MERTKNSAKKAAKELIKLWDSLDIYQRPYVINEDKEFMKEISWNFKTYKSMIKNRDKIRQFRKKRFHTGLLPSPFSGDIINARVYILALNPGLSDLDYYAETTNKEYLKEKIKKLKGNFGKSDYPFISLNPRYAWTGGGKYWLGKFEPIIDELIKTKGSYDKAVKIIAQNVATLELVPYHSKSFGNSSILNKLESVRIMKEFVDKFVLNKAAKNKAIVLVTRSIKEWGIKRNKNIILFENNRNISFRLKTRGGEAMLKILQKSKYK